MRNGPGEANHKGRLPINRDRLPINRGRFPINRDKLYEPLKKQLFKYIITE